LVFCSLAPSDMACSPPIKNESKNKIIVCPPWSQVSFCFYHIQLSRKVVVAFILMVEFDFIVRYVILCHKLLDRIDNILFLS